MNTFKCDAKVIFFDNLSGDGLVMLTTGKYAGNKLSIYACNIEGKKTLFPNTACVYYSKQQHIEVEVRWDDYATFVIGLTPGTFDQEHWDALDHNRLAFKCDDSGKATNGLF